MKKNINIELTYDEALVLYEFLARFSEDKVLRFSHPAEYLALLRVSAQFDKLVDEMFSPDYKNVLSAAQDRLAKGFEGDYGPKV